MKRYRILSILIIIVLLLNSSLVLGQTLEEKYANIKKTGDITGYIKGRSKATEQINSTTIKHSEEVRPTKEQLIIEYSLKSKAEPQYESYFIEGFYEGFDRGYYEVISLKLGLNIVDTESNYADTLGLLFGEVNAGRDYYRRAISNWVKVLPTDQTITELFDLKLQTVAYRINFIKIFKESFKVGYETGYERFLLEPKKVSLEDGNDHGEEIGSNLGIIYGTKDYYERKTNNYKRNMPTDARIQSSYSLMNDSRKYRESFLTGFKKGYEESYIKAYREANINLAILDDSEGFDNGYDIGSKRGEILATKDYTMKKASNWKANGITNTSIIKDYELILQTDSYRQAFISGFWQGFSENYINNYRTLSQVESILKSKVEEVPISGITVVSEDNQLIIDIDSGTYYNNVMLSIDSLGDNSYKLEDKYIKASNYYKIEITNPTKDYNNLSPINLLFEYYGKDNGGIYKLVNNKWIYLPSTIKNNIISTNIEPRSLNNKSGTYVVLIDNQTQLLPDIRGHWAKEEINAYVRRGYISGYTDKTFKPDRNISRAEFLTILARVYGWKLTSDIEDVKSFKDFNIFSGYDRVISYGYKNGYIKGYGDNTFRPAHYITYKEVEIIMSRVLNSTTFKFQNTAAKILYDKKIRSNFYNSKDNKITRAEFVYMLYILNEWKN